MEYAKVTSIDMCVPSNNGDFQLQFTSGGTCHITQGMLSINLYESEVDPLFRAIYRGFGLLNHGKAPEVTPDYREKAEAPSNEPQLKTSYPLTSPGDDQYDDPERVWLIRHEYKELYFSYSNELHEDRECTGLKASAVPFATRYAALRFTQGMRHPISVIEHPAVWIITIRPGENQEVRFYDGTTPGTANRQMATPLSFTEATRIATALAGSSPASFFIDVKKVIK